MLRLLIKIFMSNESSGGTVTAILDDDFLAFWSLTGSNSKADMGHVIGKSFAIGGSTQLRIYPVGE